MNAKLNVGVGEPIDLVIDGNATSGTVVSSWHETGSRSGQGIKICVFAAVDMTEGSHLKVPGLYDTDRVDELLPVEGGYHFRVHVPHAAVDLTTLNRYGIVE